jgi:molybdenum cofactor cytidylyltransferase
MDDAGSTLAGRIAVLLLAAGRATRFGTPKLRATLSGRPVIHHVAQTLADMPFAYRLCVSTQEGADLSLFGFEAVIVEPGLPMASSIGAGMAAALARDVDAVLIALADMPFVSKGHIRALLAAFDGSVVGTSCIGVAMPPAIFGRKHFERLTHLSGDSGANALLRNASLIEAPAEQLFDIDTPDDLLAAEALRGQ